MFICVQSVAGRMLYGDSFYSYLSEKKKVTENLKFAPEVQEYTVLF